MAVTPSYSIRPSAGQPVGRGAAETWRGGWGDRHIHRPSVAISHCDSPCLRLVGSRGSRWAHSQAAAQSGELTTACLTLGRRRATLRQRGGLLLQLRIVQQPLHCGLEGKAGSVGQTACQGPSHQGAAAAHLAARKAVRRAGGSGGGGELHRNRRFPLRSPCGCSAPPTPTLAPLVILFSTSALCRTIHCSRPASCSDWVSARPASRADSCSVAGRRRGKGRWVAQKSGGPDDGCIGTGRNNRMANSTCGQQGGA